MAITNTLRARLEVLGGKELVDLFDKIGDSAKKGFDKVDKEASQATREVKKLEKELKALDKIAKDIRAKIRIDKDRVPTAQEASSLALADDIDRRTSAIRRQMAALDDVAALTRGDGARILGTQGEKDLLSVRETTKAIDDLVGDGRRDGLFGDIIPDADLDRILAASERIRAENDRFFSGLADRIEAVDKAESERASKAQAKRDADATPDPDVEAKKQAAEEARRKREEEREERIRQAQERRAEQAARDAKRDQDYRDNLIRERQRIDDEIKRAREKLRQDLEENRRRLQRDIDAQRTRIDAERTAINDQLIRERQAFRDQMARARADHTDELDRVNRRNAAEMARLRTEHDARLRRDRADFLRTLGAERTRFRAQIGRDRAQFTTDLAAERASHASTLARERADFTSQQMRDRLANTAALNAARTQHRADLARERTRHSSELGAERTRFTSQLAAERAAFTRTLTADRARITQLNRDLADLRRAFDGINRSGGGFSRAAPRMGSIARGLGRTFSDAARDVGRFGAALKQLEYAVGNTALRGAIGGLLGVIGGGLAALGGAAALAGISAIAVLGSFNAQRLEKAAQSVGQALDVFTALKYAAGSKGVNFDDYLAGAAALREAMMGIMNANEDYAKTAEMFRKYQIPLLTSDGKNLASQHTVLTRLADIVKQLPNDNVRIEFLTELGGPELAKLLPMLQDGAAGINAASQRAMDMGVVLTEAQVAEIEPLWATIYDMWQIIIGLSFKLAREIMPSLLPVLEAINKYMIDNQEGITNGLVATFNYLIQVTKDFWALWKDRDNVFEENFGQDITTKWAVSFFYSTAVIVRSLKRVWSTIKEVYELAKPLLTKLADLFGMSGPLEVAITFLVGQLLGLSNLFLSLGKTAYAAARIVGNVLKNLLGPIIRRILMGVAGIIGWPVLLAASIGLVILYWEDVEKVIQWAWDKFKETFPETAAFLEKAFGEAFLKVKTFTKNMVDNFHQRFPQMTVLLDKMREGISLLASKLANFNWSALFSGISEGGMMALERLLDLLERIAPFLTRVVDGLARLGGTVIEGTSALLDMSSDLGKERGELQAEEDMRNRSPQEWEDYVKRFGYENTATYRREQNGSPVSQIFKGFWDAMKASTAQQAVADRQAFQEFLARSEPQSPVSSAMRLPTDAQPANQTPVVVNLSNGDTIVMVTPEDNVAERLNSYSRTQPVGSPSWSR